MRDDRIARRGFLAGAAAFAVAAWPDGLAVAGAAGRKRRPRRDRPERPRPLVIALDPGHGGVDPGAISPNGLYEKQITLPATRELARQLEAVGRYRVVLTRNGDVYVPLRERVARARRNHAAVLLSIHADALPNTSLRGLSVYTLSNEASDREAALLASRENRDDFVAGIKLSRQPPEIGTILLDLARRDAHNRSLLLARSIVSELGRIVPLLERPQRAAGFAVLTAPDISSALIELGCLSNPNDEKLLPQRAFQQKLAQGIARALADYLDAAVTA